MDAPEVEGSLTERFSTSHGSEHRIRFPLEPSYVPSRHSRGFLSAVETLDTVRFGLLVFISALLMASIVGQAQQRWDFLTTTASDKPVFFDSETFKLNSDRATIWLRFYEPYSDPPTVPTSIIDAKTQRAMAREYAKQNDKIYPPQRNYDQIYVTIFRDRTFREYNSRDGEWGTRSPISPESVAEMIWRQLFIEKRSLPLRSDL